MSVGYVYIVDPSAVFDPVLFESEKMSARGAETPV